MHSASIKKPPLETVFAIFIHQFFHINAEGISWLVNKNHKTTCITVRGCDESALALFGFVFGTSAETSIFIILC